MFQPSKYQKEIYRFLEKQRGHLQISAMAGSGKTSTLIEALIRQPQRLLENTLLCAFNKEIKEELSRRAPKGVTIKTNHAIGFGALGKHYQSQTSKRWNVQVDASKYRDIIKSYALNNNWRKNPMVADDREDELFQLTHFARVTLTDPTNKTAVEELIARQTLELSAPDIQIPALPEIMRAGIHGYGNRRLDGLPSYSWQETIDFDDMVWLPFVLNAKLPKFQMVMVDECQDLSAAQLWLVLNSLTHDGRLVAVGDKNQSVYGFTGADTHSWEKIQEKTQATQLPLSVCYRCPKRVIEEAQKIVPEIEAAPDAKEGVVDTVTENTFRQRVKPSDMVLCRTNAPMITVAFQLLGEGKAAKVRGRDIGASINKLIDNLAKYPGFRWEDFAECLQNWAATQYHNLSGKKNSEGAIASLKDRVESLQAIQEGAVQRGATSLGDIRSWVANLFEDKADHDFIMLSSVHRAKGLQAAVVYILRPDLMPHPLGKTPEQKVQEMNLKYVSISRAMEELYFVIEDPKPVTPVPEAEKENNEP